MKLKRLIPTGLTLMVLFFAGCEKMKILEYRGPADSQIPFTVEGTNTSSVASWAVGSQIGVYTADANGTGGANVNAAFGVKDGDLENSGKAGFSGVLSISTPAGSNKLYAYYPYVSISAITPYDAVPLTLSTTQTMSGEESHDANCSYMWASSNLSVTASGNSLAFSSGGLDFQPLVGIVNLKATAFDGSSAIAAALTSASAVQSVSITASGAPESPKLAGAFTLDLSTGTAVFDAAASSRVTANCPSGTTLGSLSARMAVNPFAISGAEESLDIKITAGDYILSKTIAAEDLTAAASFAVTAGNVSVIEVAIDDTWTLEDNVPGKIDGLYLVKINVGPTTLCFGWEELEGSGTNRNYVVQLFTDRNGSPVYTSPTILYKANNSLYNATYSGTDRAGYGPTRFTFTELSPATTYYMRVKHADNDDAAYSDFIQGTTEPTRTASDSEVFYQGFDKLFWGSDPMNSASGPQPGSIGADTPCPSGWENLITIRATDQSTTASLNAMGAFTNSGNSYGLTGWRFTNAYSYPSAGYMKLGGSNNVVSIITAAMGADVLPAEGAECTLSFKACPFAISGTEKYLNVYIVHNDTEAGGSSAVPAQKTNILSYTDNQGLNANDTSTDVYIGENYREANYKWVERTFTIPNLKPTDKIWFYSDDVSKSYRVLLDDILIETVDVSNTPLRAPSVSLDDTAAGTDRLKATWGTVSRAVSYTVAYKKTSDATFTEITGVTATEYTVTGLDPDTEYEVKVMAVAAQAALNSDYSEVVKGTTLSVVQSKLAAPAGVAAEAAFSSAAVSWTAVDGAVGYTVAVDGTDVETVGVVTGATLKGLALNRQYAITVKALASDTQYNSDYSAAVQATTKNLHLATTNVGPTTLCFGWDEVAGTRTYVVQIFLNKSASAIYTSPVLTYKTTSALYSACDPGTDRAGYGPTRFTFTELSAGTTYHMRVRHSTAGDDEYSDFIEGTTEPLHIPVAGEVFYQGFDKLYWGSDPLNSASGAQPAGTVNSSTPCPAGWDNLTVIRTSDASTSASLNTMGAFTNAGNDYGLTGWRFTNTYSYPSAGYMKFGGSNNVVSAITPAMGGDVLPAEGAECTLTFKACPFVITDQKYINVYIVHNDTEAAGTSTVPAEKTNILSYAVNGGLNANDTATDIYIGEDYREANCRWMERTFTIPNLKPTDKIWFFSDDINKSYRLMLDDIHIVMK